MYRAINMSFNELESVVSLFGLVFFLYMQIQLYFNKKFKEKLINPNKPRKIKHLKMLFWVAIVLNIFLLLINLVES